jgi:CubicO group peptidase (beta-lactamase class C family)
MEIDFSGVVFLQKENKNLLHSAHGFSNRSESITNKVETRFGIASGCKLFTAIGICQLVESGKLSFETRVNSLLDNIFPHFHESVSVHHLLTHTSGIPDYFDEEIMEDFEDLWIERPMYHMSKPEDFLPLFQHLPMKFQPGEKFHYNNAGYILLGLIIERVSGIPFTQYVEEKVFTPTQMSDSGYFSLDQLPVQTALGYIDYEDGTWKTNSYSIPIKGGADGGAFITAPDMCKLWYALMNGELLSKGMLSKMTAPWVQVNDKGGFYGYGLWIQKKSNEVFKFHVMGYDPGVSFASGYYPASESIVVIPSNKQSGPHNIMNVIEEHL